LIQLEVLPLVVGLLLLLWVLVCHHHHLHHLHHLHHGWLAVPVVVEEPVAVEGLVGLVLFLPLVQLWLLPSLLVGVLVIVVL